MSTFERLFATNCTTDGYSRPILSGANNISPAYFSVLLNSTTCPSGNVNFYFLSLDFSTGVGVIVQNFSLIFLTSSNYALVSMFKPILLRRFLKCSVTSLPPKSILSQECAREYPSYTGIT